MADIAVKPVLMRNAVLRIVADNHQFACSAIALVPASQPVVFTGLGGNSHTFPSTATWVCNLTYAQDWETPDSLTRFLHDHEGETVAAQILPQATVADEEGDPVAGVGFDVNIVIVPGQIGGQVDQTATATVSLGVDGRPTYIDEESS